MSILQHDYVIKFRFRRVDNAQGNAHTQTEWVKVMYLRNDLNTLSIQAFSPFFFLFLIESTKDARRCP